VPELVEIEFGLKYVAAFGVDSRSLFSAGAQVASVYDAVAVVIGSSACDGVCGCVA
jgi:hypothetical protein